MERSKLRGSTARFAGRFLSVPDRGPCPRPEGPFGAQDHGLDRRLATHAVIALRHARSRWMTQGVVLGLEARLRGWAACAYLPTLPRCPELRTFSQWMQRGQRLSNLPGASEADFGFATQVQAAEGSGTLANLDLEPLAQTAFDTIPVSTRQSLIAWVALAATITSTPTTCNGNDDWEPLAQTYASLRCGELEAAREASRVACWRDRAGCLPAWLHALAVLGLGDRVEAMAALQELEARAWPDDPVWRWILQQRGDFLTSLDPPIQCAIRQSVQDLSHGASARRQQVLAALS